MKTYHKPKWAVVQSYRETGLLEDICQHSIGHPNKEFLDEGGKFSAKHWRIHGCDGCCSKGEE